MNQRVPELAIMDAKGKLHNQEPLLSPELAKFIEPLVGNKEAKIIEIMGGLGIVAEALAESGCNVRLLEEQRMFFVYRNHLWPKSTVVGMNVHPTAVQSKNKIFDIAIVHSNEFLDFALDISLMVYNTSNFTVESRFNEPVTVNSTEDNTGVTENETSGETATEQQ